MCVYMYFCARECLHVCAVHNLDINIAENLSPFFPLCFGAYVRGKQFRYQYCCTSFSLSPPCFCVHVCAVHNFDIDIAVELFSLFVSLFCACVRGTQF